MAYTWRSPLEDCYNETPVSSSQQYGYRSAPHRPAPYSIPSASNYMPRPPAATYLESSGAQMPHRGKVYTPSHLAENERQMGQRPYYEQPEDQIYRPKYKDRFRTQRYPRELTDMLGAMECKLCSVEAPSPIVAKMHYSGKNHMKKVKQYLQEWSNRTGMPMPDVEEAPVSSSVNSMSNYCEMCDVRMTSLSDKMLHYSGRQHRKNERDPQLAKKKSKAYETVELDRFGIGAMFDKKKRELSDELKKLEEESEGVVDANDLCCTLCDVKAVSLDQLKMHLSGKKHKDKMEKKDQLVPKPDKPFKCYLCNVSLETPFLYKLHLNGKRHAKTLLKSEMEGYNSCEVCSVTFTCFEQFQAHMQGKKHEKKCREKYKQTIAVPEEVSGLTCKFCPFVGNLDNHKCDKSLLKIDHENLEKKYVCFPCYNMVFDSKEAYEEHKTTRRHLLCVLNQEKGDKEVIGLEHSYCHVCKVQYRANKEFTNHLFQEKHISLTSSHQTLESNPDIYKCSVCDLFMDKEAKDEHLRDRKHLKQALKKDTIAALTKLANENIATTNYNCVNCCVVLPSFVAYSNHLLSEEHMDTMINIKLKQMQKK